MITMNLFVNSVLLFLIFGSILNISSTAKNATSENLKKDNIKRGETTELPKSTLSVSQQWEELEQRLKNAVRRAINFILPRIMENTMETNISALCINNIMKLIAGLRDTKAWAMSFLDSSAKMVDGILSGSTSSLGSFDQCINTEVINERKGSKYGEILFRGKYCSLDLKPPLPPKRKSTSYLIYGNVLEEFKNFSTRGTFMSEQAKYAEAAYYYSIRLGICIPSGCTEEDVGHTLQQVIKYVPITLRVNRCEVKEETHFSILQIVIMSVFSFMGLLILIGTLIDYYICCKKQESNYLPIRILLCFSFPKNIKKLFETKSSSSEIHCLHAFRFLSASWIILLHTYLMINSHVFREMFEVFVFAEDISALVITSAHLAVDTFFCIGGMLVCYNNVRKVKISNETFSFPSNLLRRIFRIHPPYLFAIALVFLVPLMGSGPVWHDMIDQHTQRCSRNWWKNFLFINNFLPSDKCFPHCWFIAADMQLYITALIVLTLMLKWTKTGLTISFMVILSSMISSSVLSYVEHLPPAFIFSPINFDVLVERLQLLYYTPYSHAGPYFVGVMVGYFLATRPQVQIPQVAQIVGWLLAITCNMSVVYGIYGWSKGNEPTDWEVIFYSGCHRTAWSLGVAWVIFCCQTGHGGVVNQILSWKAWMPLGHLSYFAYLLHPLIMMIRIGSSRQGIQFSHSSLVWIFFGNLVATFGISVAAYLAIESPLLSLQRIVFGTGKRKETNAPGNIVHEAKNGVQKQKNDEMITVLSISKKNSTDGIENGGYVMEYKMVENGV